MLKEKLLKKRMLLDGSMGALLASMNVQAPCPDLVNCTKPEVIRGIHRAYREAGAQIMTTDSFGSTPIKLAKNGLQGRIGEIVHAAVENAKVAADGALVALNVGPTGELLQPVGSLPVRDAIEAFSTEIALGRDADLVLIETMTDIAEGRAAMLAAARSSMPFTASFSFEADGRTMMGGTPECAAIIAERLGAEAVGANCSGGPESMVDVIARMRKVCRLPLLAQPNAGMPELRDGKACYPYDAQSFAEKMRAVLNAGASCVGGCCGTTPEHIRALDGLEEMHSLPEIPSSLPRFICSARNYVTLDEALADAETVTDLDDLYDLEEEHALILLDLRAIPADELPEAFMATQLPLGFIADTKEQLLPALEQYTGIAPVVCGESADGCCGCIQVSL